MRPRFVLNFRLVATFPYPPPSEAHPLGEYAYRRSSSLIGGLEALQTANYAGGQPFTVIQSLDPVTAPPDRGDS